LRSRRRSRILSHNFFDVFLGFHARQKHFVSAAEAFEAEIHSDAQNAPLPASAGVELFHFENIANLNIQRRASPRHDLFTR